MDHLLHRDIDDLRDRDLADLLHGLDLDLRNVHVASERDVLDFDADNLANDLLHVRHLNRHILNLDLRNFDLPVHRLDFDADNLANDLLDLDLGHVADDFLDLRNFDNDVLDLHLRDLNDPLNRLDLHAGHVAIDDLRLHTRDGARLHMRHRHVHHALRSHHRGGHRGHSAHHRPTEGSVATEKGHCDTRELNF